LPDATEPTIAGCGKTLILGHSGESRSPGGLEKTSCFRRNAIPGPETTFSAMCQEVNIFHFQEFKKNQKEAEEER
jgi:hypothetical protein